ncbi:MAG: bifunctional phosphopantothenoylcysteine decarboxylase/phosphopantothenate--cysteine ligase CoaBC [Bacteriovoracaceae bacterium]|nr:bifunctional phosphopantothenoylcysteine decarboxylase/phosphopantothenate--cysteine ligase CoaBC [Bacteriovoracaceae bacterium]
MKITLAVTGSISAYKTYDLVRELTKLGHEVQVVLSKGALEFIQPNTYRYLGAKQVYLPEDDFNQKAYAALNGNVLHIEIAKQTELFLMAPMSANTLSKLVSGSAHDLLTSVFLALPATTPKHFYPAMNVEMYGNVFVQNNLKNLSQLTHTYIHPTQAGEMICGDEGLGKLAKVTEIIELTETHRFNFNQKKVLITAGATLAAVDPVRYMTNPSSGITGHCLSKKYLQEGYDVHCIAAQNSTKDLDLLTSHPHFKLTRINTTQEVQDIVKAEFPLCDIYISSAALCDMEFEFVNSKIKKNTMNGRLDFKLAPDILAGVLKEKTKQQVVGFAAETTGDKNIFLKKWSDKPVDLLIGNFVNNGIQGQRQGFEEKENQYYFIQSGEVVTQSHLSKMDLANAIYSRIH